MIPGKPYSWSDCGCPETVCKHAAQQNHYVIIIDDPVKDFMWSESDDPTKWGVDNNRHERRKLAAITGRKGHEPQKRKAQKPPRWLLTLQALEKERRAHRARRR